jgi:hypothetical protein
MENGKMRILRHAVCPINALYAIVLVLQCSLAWSQVNVLQNRNDLGGTAANLQETVLNTSNVSPSRFGRLFSYPVDGEILAQPLYVSNVWITGQGVHDVVYVATMRNVLYAFDAQNPDAGSAGQLWAIDFNQRAGAGITPFKATDVTGPNSENYPVRIGIMSTPVIDLESYTMYLVVSTSENGAKVMRLHAVDIGTGAERPGSPTTIQGAYTSGSETLIFDPQAHNQRPGLVIAGNHVIVAFSSYDDNIPYRGWIMAFDKSSLQQTGIFPVISSGANYGGGIWQSGRAPAVDQQGRVYVSTGNAFGTQGYDGVHNFGETMLCLDPERGLQPVDWFTPSNWAALDQADDDLSGSGPMLIPGTNLLATGGKEGVLYIVDSSNMGKSAIGDAQIVQKQKIVQDGHIMGGPVVWNRPSSAGGALLYHSGENDVLRAFPFDGRKIGASAVATSLEVNSGHPGGILTLSANASLPGSGIVWSHARAQSIPWGGGAQEILPGILRAYDASNVRRLLWSNQLNPRRDDAGLFAKFSVPTVANGKVYFPTWSNQLVVYGLLPTGPDFLLKVVPARNVATAGAAEYKIDKIALNNYSEGTSWTVQGLPAGATVMWLPPSADGSQTLRVQIAGSTPPGVYRFSVVVRSATRAHAQSALLVISDAIRIPARDWSIEHVDSQEAGYEAANAIDGNPATLWTSQWRAANPPPPHDLWIDLGAVYNVRGFSYLPRQDRAVDGTIRKFEAYVSLDPKTWGRAVHDGSFDYQAGDMSRKQTVMFDQAKPGRYFRLRSIFEVNFQPWTAVSELEIYGDPLPPLPENTAEQIAALRGTDNAVWIKTNQAGNWTVWHSVGGEILGDPFVLGSPNGRWDVFALGIDHAVWTQTNTGNGWLGWSSLGGVLVSRPVAASSMDGRIDLLAQGTDNAIWLRSRVNGSWSTWRSLGGCLSSPPATVVWYQAVFVFARGCDNAVWFGVLKAGAWSGWTSLGGVANSDVTAALAASGEIYIFMINPVRAVQTLKRTVDGAWGTWRNLGLNVSGNYVSPLALPNRDVAVYVLGNDKKVWGGSIDQVTGNWSGWKPIQLYNRWQGPAPTFSLPPNATIDTRGNILLTAFTSKGEIWETRTVYGEWILWAPSD